MTIDFQTWMRAVFNSIMEPSKMAQKVIGLDLPREALWTALALIAVLNVVLLALLQMLSPAPIAFEEQAFALSPFAYVGIIGVFLVLFVGGTYYTGKMMGGVGTLAATLAIIVWFQSVSLTLEAIQLVLVLISPAIASIFGMLSLGALIWCFVNFVNVLHGFGNLGKAFTTIVLALIGTALCAGIVITLLGLGPAVGAV
jgi:hypothetical protein